MSFRDVEELLAERGIAVSYETMPCWCRKFGPQIARNLPQAPARTPRRVYRYYVSSHLQRGGRQGANDNGIRIPAPAIEALVLERLGQAMPAVRDWATARAQLRQVMVEDGQLTIIASIRGKVTLKDLGEDHAVVLADRSLRIHTSMQLRSWAGRTEIVRGSGQRLPGDVKVDRSLLRALARAHALVRSTKGSPDLTVEQIAKKEGAVPSYVRRLSRLAFLAPDIQQAIVDGGQPLGVNLERLMRIDLPLSWARQKQMLGFPAAA